MPLDLRDLDRDSWVSTHGDAAWPLADRTRTLHSKLLIEQQELSTPMNTVRRNPIRTLPLAAAAGCPDPPRAARGHVVVR